jgi:predicted transcriptional regulator
VALASDHPDTGPAQATAERTAQEGKAQANQARAQAEDQVLHAYDLAVDTIGGGWDLATGLMKQVTDITTGGRGHQDGGVGAHSSQTIVVGPGFMASLLLITASTGASLLLIWIVRRLATLGGIPLLSRIAHSEIYENEARRTVSELVIAEPGLCLNDIVGRTGFSRNAVSYHLFVLEKEEEIVSVKDGKYRRYFTRNGKYVNGAKNVVAALRNETTLKLAQTVAQRPGSIQRELCIELGATPSATCWHAKRLLDLGVIRKEKVSNTVKYFPGEALSKYDLGDFGLPHAAPVPLV